MKRSSVGRAWIFVAALVIGVVFLAPIVALLSRVDNVVLQETLQKKTFTTSLMTTLVTAGAGSGLSVFFALFFARTFALYSWRAKRVARLVLLIPFLIPNFVLATAYVIAWNPGTGLLNSFVKFPFGLYGTWGLIVLFAVSHMPIAFLIFEDRLRRIDSSLREAARLSGAGAIRIFLKIDLPLVSPSIWGALALCFALNIAAFAIPAWIGAPERAYTLSYRIYQSIQLGGLDGFPQAASYGLVLFALVLPTLLILALAHRGGKKYETISAKASRVRVEEPQGRSWVFFQFAFATYHLFAWLAPLSMLFASTLVPRGCLQANGLACLSELNFSTYRYVLLELPETHSALTGTFIYGPLSALLILVLSLLLLMTFRESKWAVRSSELTFLLASSTPGAVIALGLIMVLSGRFGINLYNTAWIVVAAFMVKHMNLAFQPLRAGLDSISGSLVEAARLSGASRSETWRRILLPILRPELIGGFFLVLVPILGELTMSVFLVSPQYHSVGTLLFDLQDYADQSSAAALSILLVGTVLLLNELTVRLTNGRLGY